MPCFKGLAVSIHTPDGPLPEYGIQKQSKFNRITSFVPVPPPKIPEGSTATKPLPSTFAISITLLTPNQIVPYSTPKPTPGNPHPEPRRVGQLPGTTGERGQYQATIGPYIPLTSSPNETIAAYIYFDGRVKEEVATLLRKGEETWVNSRWVSVPESEGGGLAEREFLFREVGLERWLNGLDLQGSSKETAARIQRRRERLEKKRRKKREVPDSDEEGESSKARSGKEERNGVLRYGEDQGSPVEALMDEDDLSSSGSESDDDPIPETTGQIKVALFRVLASGEIKRGEYSPQFDAHDDDEAEQNGAGGDDADIDHTTSFAKPKTLDPKSISTQTVTGIDAPDQPYAVFTFLYRGDRQLRKMGLLAVPEKKDTPTAAKRKSTQIDFASLGPLKSTGTVGFAGYREKKKANPFGKKKKDDDAMDSDDDDDDDDVKPSTEQEDVEVKEENGNFLSPEDARRQEKLAEGVQRIKLKRQHSAEPLSAASPAARKLSASNSPNPAATAGDSPVDPPTDEPAPRKLSGEPPTPSTISALVNEVPPEAVIGSPFKKQRASLPGFDESFRQRLGRELSSGAAPLGDVLGRIDAAAASQSQSATNSSHSTPAPPHHAKSEPNIQQPQASSKSGSGLASGFGNFLGNHDAKKEEMQEDEEL